MQTPVEMAADSLGQNVNERGGGGGGGGGGGVYLGLVCRVNAVLLVKQQ